MERQHTDEQGEEPRSRQQAKTTPAPLSSLPTALLVVVFTFVDVQDLCRLSAVDHHFHQLSNTFSIWKALFERSFLRFCVFTPPAGQHLSAQLYQYFYQHFRWFYRAISRAPFNNVSDVQHCNESFTCLAELIQPSTPRGRARCPHCEESDAVQVIKHVTHSFIVSPIHLQGWEAQCRRCQLNIQVQLPEVECCICEQCTFPLLLLCRCFICAVFDRCSFAACSCSLFCCAVVRPLLDGGDNALVCPACFNLCCSECRWFGRAASWCSRCADKCRACYLGHLKIDLVQCQCQPAPNGRIHSCYCRDCLRDRPALRTCPCLQG